MAAGSGGPPSLPGGPLKVEAPVHVPPGVFCLGPGILHGDDAGGLLSVGVAIAVGAAIGLALGILVSVTTDVPLAPEVGLVLGALAGWLWRRGSV
jgi:hypothetical protein